MARTPVHARRAALAAGALAAVAACGSTVQQSSTAAVGAAPGGGLAAGATTGTHASTSPLTDHLAAGGTQAAGPAAGGATAGTSGSRSGTAAGPAHAAAVTSTLQLGILDIGTANGAAAAIGANYSTSTSAAAVTKALVRWYNKHGGMAGRRIAPVEYTIDPTSSSYVTEAEAACARFTQDNHVAAVISVVANAYLPNYEACLTKAGVPDFIGPTGTTDVHDIAANPGLVSVTAPTTNRRFEQLLTRFTDTGYLSSKDRIGIVVENCPYNDRAYSDTVAPLAKRLGLTLERRDVSCVNGFGDASAFIAAVGGAVLPFRSASVDRVLFLSNFEGVALLAFENAAKSQGYRPSYALTSTTGGASLGGQYDAEQQSRMRGVGWTPVLDVAKRVLASPTTRRCRAALKSEGITPQSKADDLLDLVCDQFFLLEASLQASAGHGDKVSLLAGLHALGRAYVSAYALRGATDFATRRDGPRLFAIWGFKNSCSCMDYLSDPS